MSEHYPGPVGEPQYPTNPYGAQPPQYGPPAQYGSVPHGQYPAPPGYNAYGYPAPQGERPGQTTASSVLAYVLAGILIFSGIGLLFGASAVNSVGDAFNNDTSNATAELAFDGIIDLVAGGLLIGGGILLSGRQRRGRALLVSGAAITLADAVYWLIRGGAGAIFVVLVFVTLAVLAIVFALSSQTTAWLNGAPPAPYRG